MLVKIVRRGFGICSDPLGFAERVGQERLHAQAYLQPVCMWMEKCGQVVNGDDSGDLHPHRERRDGRPEKVDVAAFESAREDQLLPPDAQRSPMSFHGNSQLDKPAIVDNGPVSHPDIDRRAPLSQAAEHGLGVKTDSGRNPDKGPKVDRDPRW